MGLLVPFLIPHTVEERSKFSKSIHLQDVPIISLQSPQTTFYGYIFLLGSLGPSQDASQTAYRLELPENL